MNLYAAAALLPVCALVGTAQDIPAADTHQGVAEELLDLLSRIELCLRNCNDAESVTAALPDLRQMGEEAAALSARQHALPDPTVQDYMASQTLAKDFLVITRSINRHITRLQQAGLMSAELQQILKPQPAEH